MSIIYLLVPPLSINQLKTKTSATINNLSKLELLGDFRKISEKLIQAIRDDSEELDVDMKCQLAKIKNDMEKSTKAIETKVKAMKKLRANNTTGKSITV
jgi:thioredoxin-like negative regulator of GroEL